MIEERTIQGWQNTFRALYGKRNRLRSSPERILLRLQIELSCLAESVRKNSPDIPRSLAGIGARIFALANLFELDVEALVAMKYPGHCVYCGCEADCHCLDAVRSPIVLGTPGPEIPIDKLQGALKRIYGKSNEKQGRANVFAHIAEELGELTFAVLEGNEKGVHEELADLFAWWMGYVTLQGVASISTLLYQFYPDTCSRCRQNPCPSNGTCPPL
ncbi:MAG: hypothetical protein AAB431_02820 [Patescibacteria group bacterium]